MRTDQIKALLGNGYFAVDEGYLSSLVASVNAGVDYSAATDHTVPPSHYLEKRKNVAMIVVDGAMIPKNTNMNAMCGGFVPYSAVEGYYRDAEADDSIDTIIARVKTPGGDIHGVDNLGELIYASKKRTITYFDDLGASAGIWAFSASDELYSGVTTVLGSIGVRTTVVEREEESGRVHILSRNAENKLCGLDGKPCTTGAQDKVDSYEAIFLERVSRNTGLTQDELVSGFDHGGLIFAREAEAIGFLQGVMPFDELMAGAAMPPAPGKIVKRIEGGSMTATEQEALTDVQGQLSTATEELAASEALLAGQADAIKAATEEAMKAERVRVASCLAAIPVKHRGDEALMAMAYDGVSTELHVKAAIFDKQQASTAAVVSTVTEGAAKVTEAAADIDTSEAQSLATLKGEEEDAALMAYAEAHKGSIR